MPGITEVIGFDSLALEKWQIPMERALDFEDLVGKFLRYQIANYKKARIFETPKSRDYGKDYVVTAKSNINLFGLLLRHDENMEKINIFIEAKSTQKDRLSEGFLVDYTQAIDERPDYYILVTNSSVTPYYQYLAQHNWRKRNCKFLLVDKYLLSKSLFETGFHKAFESVHLEIPDYRSIKNSNISIEYQAERMSFSQNKEIDLYISLRNFSDENRLFTVNLSSDASWGISSDQIESNIDSGYFETFKLRCDRLLFDGPADLRVSVNTDNSQSQIVIREKGLEFIFDPPFTGAIHHGIRQSLIEAIRGLNDNRLVSLSGEAGVGKTRIIDEVEQILKGSEYSFYKHHFKPIEDKQGFMGLMLDVNFDTSAFTSTTNALRHFLKNHNPQFGKQIIVFEDLHHASREIIRVFKDFILTDYIQRNVLIIITGRNDFTFPNEEYYSLIQLISSSNSEHTNNYSVAPLSRFEAEQLIKQLIYNAPKNAIEKILNLSQNNPFFIVEFIQYLLDMNIAQLLSRRYVGIIETEQFTGKTGLPTTVNELLNARISSLKSSEIGEKALDFILAMSFFGYTISKEISTIFLDGLDSDEIWWILFQRKFVKEDGSGKRSFTHENILNFLKQKCRSDSLSKYSANLILGSERLYLRLSQFSKAEVQFLSGNFTKAFKLYFPIWNRVRQITNFSSEEIDKSYFYHLSMLFESGLMLNQDRSSLVKVALAKAYMGVHNFPIYIGLKACTESEEMLKRAADRKDFKVLSNSIKQLKAHGLQNMGRTLESLKLMLEIESEIRNSAISNAQLEFDLYDRLQEYYRKTNHEKLVVEYGKFAQKAVILSKDPKLQACHLITKASVNLYKGKQKAQIAASEAYEISKKIGVFRFEVYTYLTLLIIKALYSSNKDLTDVYEESQDLLLTAANNNLSDSIMRIQLLLGTLSLHVLSDKDEALAVSTSYVKSGQENSIRYGNGLFDWAFDNLSAIIELQRGYDIDLPRAYFQTCHERLKRRGLLFLGDCDGLYPNNLAISNIVRYFGSLSEKRGMSVIKTTNSYTNTFLFSESMQREILKKALNGSMIFSKRRKAISLRYPTNLGYFLPLY